MQAAIDHLVATTFAALADTLGKVTLAGAPILRTRAVDRAIEALAGYAVGVFAAGVASRLAHGADLARATALRGALFRSTSAAQMTAPPIAIDLDALLADDRVITPDTLRARVGVRLHDSRADATRIVAALIASAASTDHVEQILAELVHADLVATRFGDQVERIWALLHGGTTYLAPPKAPKPAYCVAAIG